MNRGKALMLALLLLLPILVFIGFGGWYLFQSGWMAWLWLLFPACWGLASLLARVWRTNLIPIKPPEFQPAPYWTPRDEQTWQWVQEYAASGADIPVEKFTEFQFYADQAQLIAIEISRRYHPKADNPLEPLTISEILAAIELAVEDLGQKVEKYLPASHLLTVKHWQQLSKVPEYYRRAEPFYWALSAIFNPAGALGRYALSRTILKPVSGIMEANLLNWFFISFVQEVGFYCIEMNSGRLRGGARRFRKSIRPNHPMLANEVKQLTPETPEEPPEEAGIVTICIAGQTGAGKTSLIQALTQGNLSELPPPSRTQEVRRYEANLSNDGDRLVILDTVGYSASGATAKQIKESERAFQEADLVLLVLSANSPARQADQEYLKAVTDWFIANPKHKPPPILGVLSHIDLLSPKMEWSPPYNWQTPTSRKEESIRDALKYNEGLFEEYFAGLIPVCSSLPLKRVYGVDEWLLPAMTTLMAEAKACALVRSLRRDVRRGQTRKVFDQLWHAGSSLVKAGIPELYNTYKALRQKTPPRQ